MLEIGYKASAEQFDATELLGYARLAEELGFDSIAVSDHFQPFRHTGGHAPAALPWMGALAATTSRARLGTSVSTPTMRFHPAVLAQAFATIANLAPGRVFVGVGTGEAINEVPATAMAWPGFSERLGRLEEAVDLMRRLWTDERVTFEGRWYRTARATVYDRPERPLPILVAAHVFELGLGGVWAGIAAFIAVRMLLGGLRWRSRRWLVAGTQMVDERPLEAAPARFE